MIQEWKTKIKTTLSEKCASIRAFFKGTWTRIKGFHFRKFFRELFRDMVRDFVRSFLPQTYPILVFLLLMYFMTTPTRAGMIRTASVSPDHPCVIHVARGRRTAIQFWTKPDKVVPGAPGKLQIDFLGNDIAVSPVATDPGNLLVYTRNSRFVLIFQSTSEAGYDDVVRLVPESPRLGRPIRLNEDTYVAEAFRVSLSKPGKIQEWLATGLMMENGRRVVFDDLPPTIASMKHVQCESCVLLRKGDQTAFYCTSAPKQIKCHAAGGALLVLQEKDA
jgi:hypothetical protein